MLGDTNGDFKRKLLGKTEEKVRGYRSVALSHYCGNGYAFCVMISRKLGLDKHGIKHEVYISGGGHTWINWRHYLSEFAPGLFQ